MAQQEKDILQDALDGLRAAITRKVVGVPEPDVRMPGVQSGTNLLGLVKHLTAVERFYLLGEPVRSWPRTFKPTDDETVESVLAGYQQAIEQANEVIARWTDLDQAAQGPPKKGPKPSRRWVLVHLIEETGRHAGHADILRERIDGATGK
ncbi:DinB family protein [Kribbella sp. NPDC051770]|uniref:DinB family protein n=1 Tax=Kribbella sp. NPDC051770 TaxID=3155413 RepID=UPI0034281700